MRCRDCRNRGGQWPLVALPYLSTPACSFLVTCCYDRPFSFSIVSFCIVFVASCVKGTMFRNVMLLSGNRWKKFNSFLPHHVIEIFRSFWQAKNTTVHTLISFFVMFILENVFISSSRTVGSFYENSLSIEMNLY